MENWTKIDTSYWMLSILKPHSVRLQTTLGNCAFMSSMVIVEYISTFVAKVKSARADYVVTSSQLFNYHQTVRALFVAISFVEFDYYFSITITFMLNLKAFCTMVFFAQITLCFFRSHKQSAITLVFFANFHERVFKYLDVSSNF